eukprot:Nk52_evm10s223 gene=Nk52_evmTU10s223
MAQSLDKVLPGGGGKSSKNEWLKELGLDDEGDYSNSCENSASEDEEEKVTMSEYQALKRLLKKENTLKENAVIQCRETEDKRNDVETQLAKIKQNSKSQINILRGSLASQLKEKDDLISHLREIIQEGQDDSAFDPEKAASVLKVAKRNEELGEEKARLEQELGKSKSDLEDVILEKEKIVEHLQKRIEAVEKETKEVVVVTEGSHHSKNISELQNQLEKHRKDSESLNGEKKALKEEMNHLSAELTSCKETLKGKENELHNIMGARANQEDEINNLKQQILSLEKNEQELRESKEFETRLEEEKAKFEAYKNDNDNKAHSLTEQIQEKSEKIINFEEMLKTSESKVEQLAEQIAALEVASKAEKEEAEKIKERLEKETQALNEKLDKAEAFSQEEAEKAGAEIFSLKKQLEKAAATNQEATLKAEEEVQKMKKEVDDQKAELNAKVEANNDLNAQILNLKENISGLEATAQDSEERIETLAKELEEYKTQVREYDTMLKQADEDLKTTIFSKETEINALEMEKSTTLEELRKLENKSSEEIANLKEKTIVLTSELQETKNDKDNLQQKHSADIEEKDKEIAKSTENISSLTSQVSELQREIEQLKQGKAELIEELESSKQMAREEKDKCAALIADLEQVRSEILLLEENGRRKEMEVEEIKKSSEKKEVSLCTQISGLEDSVKDHMSTISTLQKEKAVLKTQMEENLQKSESISDELKEVTLAKETAEQQIDFLRDSLNQTTAELGSENEKLSLEKCDLEQELANVKKKLEEVVDKSAVEAKVNRERLSQLEDDLEKQRTVSASLAKKLELEKCSLEETVSKLNGEVKELKSVTIPSLEATIAAREQECQQIKDERESLASRIEILEQHEIPEMETKLKQQLSQVEALQKQRENLQAAAAKSEEEQNCLADANAQLEEANKRLEALELDLVRREHDYAKKLSEEKSILQANLDEVSKQASTEMEDMKSKLHQVLSGLAKMKTSVRELKSDSLKELTTMSQQFHNVLGPEITKASQKIRDSINEQDDLNKDLVGKYKKEMILRKKYFNELVSMKGNIRVMCRVRPTIKEDKGTRNIVAFDKLDSSVINVESRGTIKALELDEVFQPNSTQEQVFGAVKDIITSAVDGFNVCIFAYGQTGSGKTFTMEGSPDNPGVNVRGLQELFQVIQDRKPEWEYTLNVGVLEIYNETIRDLLSSKQGQKLDIKQTRNGTEVPGIEEIEVQCVEDIRKTFEIAHKNRRTAETSMNERSSRSHSVMVVKINGFNETTGVKSSGKINLIDLAGSERVSKSEATGDRLKEAQNINKSLSALGDVIHALASRSSHVPYRNSKLTYMLQDSLSGDSKTLMICQIGPAEYNVGETMCTLNFAARVRSVELGPPKKHSASSDTEKNQLENKVKELEKELAASKNK